MGCTGFSEWSCGHAKWWRIHLASYILVAQNAISTPRGLAHPVPTLGSLPPVVQPLRFPRIVFAGGDCVVQKKRKEAMPDLKHGTSSKH